MMRSNYVSFSASAELNDLAARNALLNVKVIAEEAETRGKRRGCPDVLDILGIAS